MERLQSPPHRRPVERRERGDRQARTREPRPWFGSDSSGRLPPYDSSVGTMAGSTFRLLHLRALRCGGPTGRPGRGAASAAGRRPPRVAAPRRPVGRGISPQDTARRPSRRAKHVERAGVVAAAAQGTVTRQGSDAKSAAALSGESQRLLSRVDVIRLAALGHETAGQPDASAALHPFCSWRRRHCSCAAKMRFRPSCSSRSSRNSSSRSNRVSTARASTSGAMSRTFLGPAIVEAAGSSHQPRSARLERLPRCSRRRTTRRWQSHLG